MFKRVLPHFGYDNVVYNSVLMANGYLHWVLETLNISFFNIGICQVLFEHYTILETVLFCLLHIFTQCTYKPLGKPKVH